MSNADLTPFADMLSRRALQNMLSDPPIPLDQVFFTWKPPLYACNRLELTSKLVLVVINRPVVALSLIRKGLREKRMGMHAQVASPGNAIMFSLKMLT